MPMDKNEPMKGFGGPKKPEMGGMRMGPGMRGPAEKAKDFKGTLRRLIQYLKPFKVSLVIVVIMSVLGTTSAIVGPKILGNATTEMFRGLMLKMQGVPGAAIDFDKIAVIMAWLIGLYLISSVFTYVNMYIMAAVAQRSVYNMRKELNDKLQRLPLKFFDDKAHGDVLSRVTNDMDNISSTMQQSLTQLISSIITMLGIIIMMLTISPWMTLITLVTLPLSAFATKFIATKSQKQFKIQQKTLGQLNGHVEEMYTGHKIVKAYGKEEDSIKEFDQINEELYEAGWKAQFISGIIMPAMGFINNIGYVIVTVAGSIFVTKGTIAIGDVQAFIQYSRQFTQPIAQTANIANVIQSTIASAERVFEILDEKEEIKEVENPVKLENPRGDVTVEHVSFGYSENNILMKDMTLDVKQGSTIAIVGPTGAGKTTLVNLLMRFYEVNGGRITIDGVNINDMRRGDLRSIFGMVLQDTWLFNGTIRDNIAYGLENATDEQIIEAAKAAHADHFIRTLPDGYDTVLNEEASNISQGQKQLLTIARAILANPAVLILDEATSSVDTRTEAYIQHAMLEMMKVRTSFVIAHRLSTIRDADTILVMNEGDIIETGNHEELMQKNGFYAELYNSQFMGREI
ncbi:MAG: ABC transporter ATP-binding protein [Clostridia bacterium]|nr:ABC transporter ATP-binding protein [Clostridia bacterium]